MFDTTPSPTFDAPTGTEPRSMNGVLVLLLLSNSIKGAIPNQSSCATLTGDNAKGVTN